MEKPNFEIEYLPILKRYYPKCNGNYFIIKYDVVERIEELVDVRCTSDRSLAVFFTDIEDAKYLIKIYKELRCGEGIEKIDIP